MVKENCLRFKTQADCISVSGQMPHLIDYWIHYFACGVTLLAISVVYVEGLRGSYVGVTSLTNMSNMLLDNQIDCVYLN